MSIHLNYDIGHCETTATTIRVEDGADAVKRLDLDGSHNKVIPSAIFLTFDQIRKLSGSAIDVRVLESLGEIRIGLDAPTQPKDGEYFIYFKRSPEEFDKPCGNSPEAKAANLTSGKLMAAFIYQAVKNSLAFNDDKLTAGSKNDLSLMIGCPATEKWTANKNKEKYAELVRKATGIQKVTIVPESRAAIFSAIGSASKAISAAKGVMVFDFGSSTADCTYMLLGRQIKEYSWDLGASLIEQQLMQNALMEAKQKDRTATPGTALNKMLRDLRSAKENFYQAGEETEIVCKFNTADGKVIKQLVAIDGSAMERATAVEISVKADSTTVKEGSWQELCREFMAKGRDYLNANGLTCGVIVLTGGASHMDFIGKLCREVFGKDMVIVRDKSPSYCVATGLSWVSIVDERHDACVEDAKKLLREDPTCNYETLKQPIQDAICTYVFNVVSQEAKAWGGLPGELPVADLESRIRKELSSETGKNDISAIVRKEIESWIKKFQAGATQAINSQSQKIFSENIAADLLISDVIWKRLDTNSVSVDFDPSEVSNRLDLSGIGNKIVQMVAYYCTVIAITIALSEFPGINYIVGILAGWVAQYFVSDDDKNKLRNEKARRKIAKQMPKILNDKKIINSFKSSVSDAMDSVQKQYNTMVDDIVSIAIDMVMLRRFNEE